MEAKSIKAKTAESEIYLSVLENLIKENYNSATFPNVSFPRDEWAKLSEEGLMLSMIQKEFGGRYNHEELCDIIEMIAKYNLPLAMYTMIVTALFMRNVAKYGGEELKQEVLTKFSSESLVGGFGLTEPCCGSNMARMETTFEEKEDGYVLIGEKHWQAFSGTADWWVVAAKNKNNNKDFGYFVISRCEGWSLVEKYEALGLKAIDYGRSKINAFIPKYRRLNVTSEGLTGAVDMLCGSRLSMCAMASGFISRIYNEAKERTKTRKMGDGVLYDVGYVRYRLKLLSANKTITKALFVYLKYKTDFREVLLDHFFEAQAIKVLATDKMLESALNYQQFCGGEGYRYDSPTNNAAYALLDSRVYTIFDGTNDLLSQQLAEFCVKESKDGNVVKFLSEFDKTKSGITHINFDLSVLNSNHTQEERVMNGQIISRIFGLQCIEEALQGTEKHFEYGDFRNAVLFLNADIKKTIAETEILKNNCLACM